MNIFKYGIDNDHACSVEYRLPRKRLDDHEGRIISFFLTWLKADFHSVLNVGRSIFIERFLLKCVKSTTANEIRSAYLLVFQKKALA